MNELIFTILIGIGATAGMDLWSLLRKQMFNIPPTNWGMVGRWIAYMKYGQFHHTNIAASDPFRGEQLIGWTAHYAIGIAYATLLVITGGTEWIHNPSIGPALTVGIATVVAPFFILQPGMGAGFAACRTPKPNSVRLQSVINHAVFGFGLFLSALIIKCTFSQ
ncbi:Uncharacterised protein [Zhongshania aliphaticivorans]|uniref:DUF2938 domain-containing protein n=1 Tax=Zhongshania aliphaticivorans TaxID=1470434 RepID=A0A5S9NRL5_9GAMM|nr:DUF2938 domain-containing protein [Zhongshania aliphaticivorans]CAA0093171.1 Uncharacterised protein [Zhongshania aliphaticivorans]CAA0110966.1 Uncharacterised protein [Zhongshania aliphaticivorans]